MQFTYTNLAEAYDFARFRAYIDGETEPSIDVTMEPGMFAIAGPDLSRPPQAIWGFVMLGFAYERNTLEGESGEVRLSTVTRQRRNFPVPWVVSHTILVLRTSILQFSALYLRPSGPPYVAVTVGKTFFS